MRHERPQPGQPSPVEELNAELFARQVKGHYASRTRADIGDGTGLAGDLREAVLADMVKVLNEARLDRGYADIYDLKRAGYHEEAVGRLGAEASKLLAVQVRTHGERYGVSPAEAA